MVSKEPMNLQQPWQTDTMSFSQYGLQSVPWVRRPPTDVDFSREERSPYARIFSRDTVIDTIAHGIQEKAGLGEVPRIQLHYFKYGKYEEVYRAYVQDTNPAQTYIVTAAHLWRNDSVKNRDIFVESTAALSRAYERSSTLGIRAFVGPSTVVDAGGMYPMAIYPESPEYEEMNLTFSMRHERRFPHFRLYTQGGQTKHPLFDGLPDHAVKRLNAYIVGKILSARTLQALMTLEDGPNGSVHGLYPRDSFVAAGDYIGHFDDSGKLRLKAVCYGGGTEQIGNMHELVDRLAEAQEHAVRPEADFAGIRLVPDFPEGEEGRRAWVQSVVASTVKDVYSRARHVKEEGYTQLLDRFLAQSSLKHSDLPKTSPFRPDAMNAVAENFGPQWITFLLI